MGIINKAIDKYQKCIDACNRCVQASDENKNGALVIKSTRKTNLMQENLYVDIYLPANFTKSLVNNATSGSITAEQITADKITAVTSPLAVLRSKTAREVSI